MKMMQLFWSFEHLFDGEKKCTIEIESSVIRLWRDDLENSVFIETWWFKSIDEEKY